MVAVTLYCDVNMATNFLKLLMEALLFPLFGVFGSTNILTDHRS